MKFEELGIDKNIIDALYKQKYEEPSEIQVKAIPQVLAGKDVLGLAQTGTGKTAAFAVPTIQILSKTKTSGKPVIRALVLAPTRELAIQVHDSFKDYSVNSKMRSTVIYGGVGQNPQVRALKQGVDILVATPGRLFDLIDQGFVRLNSVEVFILDEADRMLDMGFIHDIKKTIKLLPKKKQSLLFSATMPKEINQIVKEIMVDPVQVAVSPISSPVEKITQKVYFIDRVNKPKLLLDILKENEYKSFLVFTRTKRMADQVTKRLSKEGVRAAAIHGDKSQNARQRALNKFKDYQIQVLVATDIAARGIDIDELDFVLNYDLPEEAETYVHRIGRTGRKGLEGASLSFCSFQEIPLLKDIEKLNKMTIEVEHDHPYEMKDRTPKAKRKGRQKSKQSSRRGKPQEESQGQRKGKAQAKKPYQGKKKQNGPHDWSNHRGKSGKGKQSRNK